MSDVKYFTFPVAMLQGAFTNIRGVCDNIFNYAAYVKYYEVQNVEAVESFFGITLGNKERSLKDGKALFEKYGNRCPMVSLNSNILFEFYKNPKTEFEIAVFCVFCGLRSILGNKSFTKSNNDFLIARMFGYRDAKELKDCKRKPDYLRRYLTTPQKIRYQLTEKIIHKELVLDWGLKYYGCQSRGFYVSFGMDLENLVFEAEKAKKTNKLKDYKARQAEAVKQAKKRLGVVTAPPPH